MDFLFSALLIRCMGVARKPMAVIILAGISQTSNVNMFQKDKNNRRLADILCSFRLGEFLIGCVAGFYYFKFRPGGADMLSTFLQEHTGASALFVLSLGLYLLLLGIWLE